MIEKEGQTEETEREAREGDGDQEGEAQRPHFWKSLAWIGGIGLVISLALSLVLDAHKPYLIRLSDSFFFVSMLSLFFAIVRNGWYMRLRRPEELNEKRTVKRKKQPIDWSALVACILFLALSVVITL